MSAYAEEAHGKAGFFMTFYLYFFSLAIGNVAIAISAVGYLATFFPWLSSTPIATCIGVIGLIWLTTVANFGGPRVTGRIGTATVWGVILPVGLLSAVGWFWFSGTTFAAAWNPTGISIGQGLGSSISLTLWAFLGMESAAQNSAAVENPKRNVPLACMLGTLGAACVYILSTTVIQGIVPNAELAASTGPFALAYAKMFNPTIGSIIMALAVLACLGSLLGWQFTIAQTGSAPVQGAVTDASGAVVPNADVKVHSLATGADREIKTDGAGLYVVPSLQPGDYKVQATAAGFSTYTVQKVTLSVDQTVTVNMHLTVSATGETVQVESTAAQIESQTITVGQVIGRNTVQELPLNGRHFLDLTVLTPGGVVAPTSGNLTSASRG